MSVPFTCRAYDLASVPLSGLTPAVTAVRRNVGGTYTTLDPRTMTEVSDQPGFYEGSFTAAELPPGTLIQYRVDLTAAAAPRYIDAELDAGQEVAQPTFDEGGEVFTMRRGDLLPFFEKVLRDERGARLDLGGEDVTVMFQMRLVGGVGLVVEAGEVELVNGGSKGRVRYEWESGDTDLVGIYEAEFLKTAGEEGLLTLPIGRRYRIEILPALSD